MLTTTVEVLERRVKPTGIISERKMHRLNAEMMQRMNDSYRGLALLKPIESPRLPDVHTPEDLSANARLWAEQIDQQLIDDDVGRATVCPQGLICTFYETETSVGLLNHTHQRIKHTHKIARPQYRRLPFAGEVPAKGKKVIDILTKAGLEREVRIVTGDLIGEDVRVAKEWKERSAFGSFLDSGAAALVGGAALVGAALASGGAALAAMPATFAADPCILVGDLVFWGWKE